MTMTFSKSADTPLTTDAGAAIEKIRIVFDWEEAKAKGFLKRTFDRGVDVDTFAVVYQGTDPIEAVRPERTIGVGGAIVHGGDVKRGAGEGVGENITFDFTQIREQDDDIAAIAVTAACKSGGFDRVEMATAMIFDVTGAGDGPGRKLGQVRVPIQGSHTGAVIGTLKKTSEGWAWRTSGKLGQGRTWQELGHLAVTELGRR